MTEFLKDTKAEKFAAELNINSTAKEIMQNNINKGFVKPDEHRPIPEMLMLIVSELGEALDADRGKKWADLECFEISTLSGRDEEFKQAFELCIKSTFEDEIADAFIRILNVPTDLGFDLEKFVRLKMRYNSLRPHKHGKQY